MHSLPTGMVATAARTLLECLDRLPNEDSRTKICIIGFDTALHFFSLAVSWIHLLKDKTDAVP